MAFDINLLYSLKRAGFKILEVPTEWTDKIGSKVALGKTSLVMLLSVPWSGHHYLSDMIAGGLVAALLIMGRTRLLLLHFTTGMAGARGSAFVRSPH